MTRFCSTAILILLTLISCKKEKTAALNNTTALEFAKGFSIERYGTYTEVNVIQPYQTATTSTKYLLVREGSVIQPQTENTQIIQVPVKSLVCTSTSHIALLEQLNAVNTLTGFPDTDLISSRKSRSRIDSGKVVDLGIDNALNLESLLALQPDMVMSYSITGEMAQLKQLQQLGIPVVINAEYLEQHPLGRAEWIKFMACFLDKEELADSIFSQIRNDYLNVQSLVEQVSFKPTVITGILYGDSWFLPGGENYAARLFHDAGYNYVWNNDPSNGFLKLSFETVYAMGKDADYWIGVGSFNSLSEMQAAEKRYSLFKSFASGQVYTYNARKGPTGGSEYLELGYSRPDLVIRDLIKIAHPELLSDYSLFFHQKLE